MTVLYIVLGLAAVILLWGITQYNFFVSAKARIKASIQEIGNQLKRQVDLIPNLESSAKGYMKHEKGIFDALTDARKSVAKAVESGDLQKMSDAGSKVADVLPQLQILVESNPQIQASGVVTQLMTELRDTSDKVMYARRLLIDLTADYNVKRVTFPSSIIAGMFNFEEQKGLITPESGEHVEVSGSDMKTPKVDLG
jgi:LemA protein